MFSSFLCNNMINLNHLVHMSFEFVLVFVKREPQAYQRHNPNINIFNIKNRFPKLYTTHTF